MIKVKVENDISKLNSYLKRLSSNRDILSILNKYGNLGVKALRDSTPIDSGDTANAWSYEIVNKNGRYEIQFDNSNVHDGVSIAIILQYGHGTRNGGYVEGRDYINPALKKVFDDMTNELIKEVGHL